MDTNELILELATLAVGCFVLWLFFGRDSEQ